MERDGVYECPYCGNQAFTDVIEDMVESSVYYERWKCPVCQRTWWEEYELTHKATSDEDGNEIDNDEECK